MTLYYILAPAFGAFATILFLVGHKKPDDFPGKLYTPIILVSIVFAVGTMAAVITGSASHGGGEHETGDEPAAAEQAEESH